MTDINISLNPIKDSLLLIKTIKKDQNIDCDKISFLIESGIDVNKLDNNNLSALMHLSVKKSDNVLEMMNLLIESGADVNKQTIYGGTILMIVAQASCNFSHKKIDLLIKNGAKLDCQDHFGKTALMFAIQFGFSNTLNMVKSLVENGSDVNIQTKKGWTALMFIAERMNSDIKFKFLIDQNKDIIRTLIYSGADIKKKNINGQTALNIGGDDFCDFINKIKLEKKSLVKSCLHNKVMNQSSCGGGGGRGVLT